MHGCPIFLLLAALLFCLLWLNLSEPPTQDSLREKLLEEEYARTKSLLQECEAEKMKNGCSIMTDT